MHLRPLHAILISGSLLLLWQNRAQAGMPSIEMTDLARARLEVISFFAVVYLLLAVLLRVIWNFLAKDWKWMPRMTFLKSLSVMLVAGLFCYVVLTMISGARELMTPGAWKKDGLTYRLNNVPAARQSGMEKLRAALLAYAGSHGGNFPPSINDPAVPADVWSIEGFGFLTYRYIPGLRTDTPRQLLAEEPAGTGPERWVLFTDGSISKITAAEEGAK